VELQSTSPELTGHWDESRLERALSNLVENALKYSPDGGTVRVTISPLSEGGVEYVLLSVSDEGIGIPESDLERIFDRFQRGSNVPERLSGSGVGLSYVREIVVRHGGSIAVESQVSKGTTFTIQLPRGIN
jgi:signal transduction histidine kinase